MGLSKLPDTDMRPILPITGPTAAKMAYLPRYRRLSSSKNIPFRIHLLGVSTCRIRIRRLLTFCSSSLAVVLATEAFSAAPVLSGFIPDELSMWCLCACIYEGQQWEVSGSRAS